MENYIRNVSDGCEQYFYNALNESKIVCGVKYDQVTSNVKDVFAKIEVDVLLINGEEVLVVEVKQNARISHIKKLRKKFSIYKKVFPEFKDYQLKGALASFSLTKEVKKEALKEGLLVMERKGELIITSN